MTADQILAWTIAILTSAGTVLMAIKGIMNSKDYREAKEAIIQSKDAIIERKQADIDSLKSQTPSFMAAQYNAVKQMADDNDERLTKIIDDYKQELKESSQLHQQDTLEKGKEIARLEEFIHVLTDAAGRQGTLGALLQGMAIRPSPVKITLGMPKAE